VGKTTKMINKQAIIKILPIFLTLKDSDDSTLSKAIEESGLEKETAERIAAFFPSAFAHVAFSHKFNIHFSESYTVDGTKKLFYYKEEPIFKIGIELAIEIYHEKPELSAIFNSIVTRSCECDAINKALNAGADISGSKFLPNNYFGYQTIGKKRSIFSKLFS
jgi:hypothetical protein